MGCVRSKLKEKGIVKKILNHVKLLHLESCDEFEIRYLKKKSNIYKGSELKYDNFSEIN